MWVGSKAFRKLCIQKMQPDRTVGQTDSAAGQVSSGGSNGNPFFTLLLNHPFHII